MMKKIMVFAIILLVSLVLLVNTLPVLADDSGSTQQPAQSTDQFAKGKFLARLLMVQDEAKVDAFLANAVSSGKLNEDQAAKIKELWVNRHDK